MIVFHYVSKRLVLLPEIVEKAITETLCVSVHDHELLSTGSILHCKTQAQFVQSFS